MGFMEGWTLIVTVLAALLVGMASYSYRRWQESVERERFVLSMKAASTPEQLDQDELERLKVLRAPWWALWRWVPARLGDEHARRFG